MPPTRRSTRPPTNVSASAYSRANNARSVQGAGRSVRSTRNPRAVVEPDSDEDMVDDEPELQAEVDDDEDEEEEEDEDEDEDDEDENDDAEGEDDEDELAAPHPPPPRIQQTSAAPGRTKLKIAPPREGTLKSVEAKELEDDDDQLSDVDSDDDIQNTTAMDLDDDDEELEDEEDEDDEEGEQEEDEEEDAEGEDDSELGSGSATPDLSKLTRRQRGEADDFVGGLMALSNEAKTKKHISAEEHVMRRAEMARRRKNLSEKRNEEEKIDTINKLLSKPAPKRRTRAEIIAAQAANDATPGADEESSEVKPDPVYVRWVSNAAGSRIGVPVEWLESPAASNLAHASEQQSRARIMVEEVA